MNLIFGASINEQLGIGLVRCSNPCQEHISVWFIDDNVSDIGIAYLFTMQGHAGYLPRRDCMIAQVSVRFHHLVGGIHTKYHM